MRLSELGITVRNVDLGRFDAESDYKLAQHFVTTAYVDSALSGPRTLLLGRKGSGKSALFRQMPELVAEAGLRAEVLPLTPDAYAWAALKGYQEQGLLPEHAHTNAWKLTLAIEVAGRLGAMDRAWSRKTEDAIRTLRRFVTDNFGNLEPGLLKTASGLVKGLTSFNLSAFGFSVGVDREKGTPGTDYARRDSGVVGHAAAPAFGAVDSGRVRQAR
jgi:energy-coupling factor transporter ATP-binding protein EcfA2